MGRFNESLTFYGAPVAMTLTKFALCYPFGYIVGVAKGRPRVSLTNSLQQPCVLALRSTPPPAMLRAPMPLEMALGRRRRRLSALCRLCP